jgi:hypothetical protein
LFIPSGAVRSARWPTLAPGDQVRLEVLRYGTQHNFDARLGQFTRPPRAGNERRHRPRPSCWAESLTPQLVVIVGVDPTSPAAGDVVSLAVRDAGGAVPTPR